MFLFFIFQDNKAIGEQYGIHPRDVESKLNRFIQNLFTTVFIILDYSINKGKTVSNHCMMRNLVLLV